MKMRRDDNPSCEVYVYVDKGRITGWCKLDCWKAARQFCSALSYLGIQDVSKKRTEPSMLPGPWAGTVVYTMGKVVATITKIKWKRHNPS